MKENVDILLTTYNTKIEYLKKQIDSILNQTYKNFNLIISDDCSTKKEVIETLKEYEQKDERIKLYLQENNLGYTKNFEFVLTKSEANYIAFSDHDDIWYDNKIEESLKILIENKVDLVYCDARQIDENEKVLHESYLKYKNMPIKNDNDSKLAFARHIAIGCCQMFTKDVKDKILPFTENTIAHDWNTVYVASRLKGVFCIKKPLMDYRLHGNNAFGGRSFKQNMKLWKDENGNTYKSYLKYRYHVITETYLAGSLMCMEYSKRLKEDSKVNKNEEEIIKYYQNSQKSKIINLGIFRYFKYLFFNGIGKKMLKEIMILHFPLISYIIFILY